MIQSMDDAFRGEDSCLDSNLVDAVGKAYPP